MIKIAKVGENLLLPSLTQTDLMFFHVTNGHVLKLIVLYILCCSSSTWGHAVA